jgi:taurine dioxygenase
MASQPVHIVDLDETLPFGAKVRNLTRESLQEADTRRLIKQAFEGRALLVFEDVEQSSQMQLAISEALGPLKNHPVSAVSRSGADLAPGIIDINSDPNDQVIVEVEGKRLANWLPWHFDHSYNNELNLAGVLRPIVIAPEGGLTGFADGIDLYDRMPADLRERIEGLNVLYHLGVMIGNMQFGKPNSLRELHKSTEEIKVEQEAKKVPRSIHPAVWTRKSGEKVLHVGMLHAVGIEGHEDRDGASLLEDVCRYIAGNSKVYYHQWKLGQMLTWDNWRMLHCVTGCDPGYARRMHRSTIQGDYGLGRFEDPPVGQKA